MSNLTLSVEANHPIDVDRVHIESRAQWLARRQHVVGASEVAALFGIHPKLSAYQLFGIKTGQWLPSFSEAVVEKNAVFLPPNERGLLLEPVALALMQRINPDWDIRANSVPGGSLYMHKRHRLASTPDAHVYGPQEGSRGAVQIKSVAEPIFNTQWMQDGGFEPPLWIMVQTMIDAALSGCDHGYVAALVIGYSASLRLFRVDVRPSVVARAFDLVDEFWDRVSLNRPYEPDFAKDGEVIAGLYADDDGSTVTLTGDEAARVADLLTRREGLKVIEKAGADAAKERKDLDTQLIFAMKNASGIALGDGRIVTAKTTKRGAYTVQPTSFRTVRVVEPSDGGKRASGARAKAPALAAMPDSF